MTLWSQLYIEGQENHQLSVGIDSSERMLLVSVLVSLLVFVGSLTPPQSNVHVVRFDLLKDTGFTEVKDGIENTRKYLNFYF